MKANMLTHINRGNPFWIIVIFLSINCFSNHLLAQVNNQPTANSLNLAPPSSAATSSINSPNENINLFTGSASVSIPLYSYSTPESSLGVNVSVGYHGGGIKIEELASNIGLGWSLNVGGLIVRNTIGIMDDDSLHHGYLFMPALPNSPGLDELDRLAYGCFDGEQDIFYYMFNGHRGAFIIGKDWRIMTIPSSKIKIEIDRKNMIGNNPPVSSKIASFIITDETGVKYFFGEKELSSQQKFHRIITKLNGNIIKDSIIWDSPDQFGVSSWYLSKILSPFGTDSIVFDYDTNSSSYSLKAQETQMKNLSANDSTTVNNESRFTTLGKRLREIKISPNHYISFVYDSINDRSDLPGDHALLKISIRNFNYNLNYFFSYKYLYSTQEMAYTTPKSNFSTDSVMYSPRLILKSIVQKGGNVSDTLFKFDYIDYVNSPGQFFPGRYSYEQDHWGYYNGRHQYQTLIPIGDTRDPNLKYDTLASLKRITNQFGGYTEFKYGQNQVYSASNYRNEYSGGIRVDQVTKYDGISHNNDIIKEYRYVQSDGVTSSGFGGEYPGYNYNLTSFDICSGQTSNYLITTSISNYPLLFVNGSPVGYARVEEVPKGENESGGKIVYEFTSYHDVEPIANSISAPYSSKQRKADWCYGLLKRQIVYDNKNREVSEIEHRYNFIIEENPPTSIENWRSIKSMAGSFLTAGSGKPTYLCLSDKVSHGFVGGCSGSHQVPVPMFLTDIYVPFTGRIELENEITKKFYGDGSFSFDTVAYSYDPNTFNVKVITTSDGIGSYLVKKIFYPNDYSVGGAIGKMRDNGIIFTPVNTETWHLRSQGDSVMVNGISTDFQILSNGDVKPYKQYKLITSSPLKISDIGPFNPGKLIRNQNYYKQITSYDSYNLNGNLIQETERGMPTQSMIWDYDQQYQIAKVDNASSSDIAFTSFETEFNGNWTLPDNSRNSSISLSGQKSYTLGTGKTIFKNGLSTSKKYIVSYWSRNGSLKVNGTSGSPGYSNNGWTYFEHVLAAGSSTINITCNSPITIDELRLFPQKALMTTYTYIPSVGINSQCGPDNRMSYFMYDSIGRLQYVKDMEGNIVKTIQHKF